MICPKCNAKIKDDRLYCEKCGYEVNMVPAFEPEVYENMYGTLHDIAKDVDEDDEYYSQEYDDYDEFADFNFDEDDDDDKDSIFSFIMCKLMHNKVALAVLAIMFVILVGFLSLNLFRRQEKPTFRTHYDEAVECAASGDYSGAIKAIEKAIDIDNTNMEAKLLRADYYYRFGRVEDAVNLYIELSNEGQVSERASIKVIEYYLGYEDYSALNKFLLRSNVESIKKDYAEYMAAKPTFSVPEGTYAETINVSIQTNGNGKVYYTLDSTTPNESSDRFYASEKIEIAAGVHVLKAIFVNEYGQVSDTASAQYVIQGNAVNPPVIYANDGDYVSPEYISVEADSGCKIYYTTDGTPPTMEEGKRYTGVIPMRMGKTIYTFVAFDSTGQMSEPMTLETNLKFDYVVSVKDSVNSLINRLVTNGVLLDTQGHVANKEGFNTYECEEAFTEYGLIFYLVREVYNDIDGNVSYTGKKYAIDSSSGYLYSVSTDALGFMKVSLLN